jgi:hypothetical protein
MKFDKKRKDFVRNIAEVVDHLITTQFYSAGGGSHFQARPVIQDLYEAARENHREPLTYLAAMNLLERIKENDRVIILTGFIVAPTMRPESDGPVGAASLARALDLTFGATPVIVTEKENIEKFSALCQASGLQVDALEMATAYPRKVAILPFPLSIDRAKKAAADMLDRLSPSAIICIERPSSNEKGVYHNGFGFDVSCLVAKTDYLIEEAAKRNILTIGIGDGGNEVGMGCISEKVKEVIPTGAKCGCPCGSGITAVVKTDILVVATIANWGSYGIETCLAAAMNAPHILHSEETERKILEAASLAGIVDPALGTSERTVDGTPQEVSISIVNLMRQILDMKMIEDWGRDEVGKIVERRPEVEEMIKQFGAYLASKED